MYDSIDLAIALPARIFNVFRTIIHLLQENKIPVTISSLSPSTIRSLLPSTISTLRPGPITTAIFPHLKNEPSISLAMLLPPSKQVQASGSSYLAPLRRVQSSASFVLRFANLPLDLTRQECRYNRKALERLRDERAEVVGKLAQLRSPMSNLVRSSYSTNAQGSSEHETVLASLAEVILPHAVPNPSLLVPIQQLALWLPGLRQQHVTELNKRKLLRPSVLTRIWPSALVFPPLALYIYTSRTSWVPALLDMIADARETVRGFVQGWLVEPLVGVINTVRGGGKGDMLVHEEGVLADIEVTAVSSPL